MPAMLHFLQNMPDSANGAVTALALLILLSNWRRMQHAAARREVPSLHDNPPPDDP